MSFFKDLISDDNHINEKIVVGIISFILIVATMVLDLISAYFGKPLQINEFVFNGMLMLCLGSFGISSVDRMTSSRYRDRGRKYPDADKIDTTDDRNDPVID